MAWKRVVAVAEMAAAMARPVRLNSWIDAEIQAAARDERHDLELCWTLAPRTMRRVQDHWQSLAAGVGPRGTIRPHPAQIHHVIDALADSKPLA